MIDGILDLLAAILVMGIVIAIAFGFIIPLTDVDMMNYNTAYYDKAQMNSTADYSDPNTFSTMDKRLYTYEELVLLLYVQDDKMEEPKGINFRNLIIDTGKSYMGSMIQREKEKPETWGKVNINTIGSGAFPISDSGFNAIRFFTENPVDRIELSYPTGKDKVNIARYEIGGDFFTKMTGQFGIATYMADSYLTNSRKTNPNGSVSNIGGPRDAVPHGHSDYDEYKDSLEAYNNRRYYYIGYRIAVPDGSVETDNVNKYVKELDTNLYHKNYDEKDSYFIEIQGVWPNGPASITTQEEANKSAGGATVVNTYQDYKNYLSDIRSNLNYK